MTTDPALLAGRAVVVIGGSAGIGREIARQAMAQRAEVTITGRDPERLAASDHGDAKTAVLDAHDEAALDRFFSRLGSVDHIVSMVGDSMAGGFLTTTPQTMRHVLHSKFRTNWLIGRHAAATLRTGGSLTFTSGTGGRAQDVSASYVANLGIGALVAGLAHEMAPRHRVNAIAPTFMDTNIAVRHGAQRPLGGGTAWQRRGTPVTSRRCPRDLGGLGPALRSGRVRRTRERVVTG